MVEDRVPETAELSVVADPSPTRQEQRVTLLKAVADPIRLAVLDRLATHGARCHCDLEAELDLAPNRLAFHLKVLRQAGLVRATRRGRRVRYHLEPGALETVRGAIPMLTDPGHLSPECSVCDRDDAGADRGS